MMNWMELSNQYFQWWQNAASRCSDMFKEQPYFFKDWGGFMDHSLQFKKMADQMTDEMWRGLRLPSREEVNRLHERLNHLESLLMDIQQADWAEEVGARVLKKAAVASPDDLKPLRKTLNEMEKRIAGVSDLDLIKEGVAQMGAKLDSLSEEAERIKEMVAQSGSKPETPSATPKRPGKRAPKKTSGGA